MLSYCVGSKQAIEQRRAQEVEYFLKACALRLSAGKT